ncbi:MAG: hypothetical protein HYX74_03235 [Acidobacteria bacterium]|nr:hypothetical protein [Acidobacteriota bacterium]
MKITALFTTSILVLASLMTMPTAKADTLYLQDGRFIDGTYLGGTAHAVRFRAQGLITTYPVTEVLQIKFESASGVSSSSSRPATSSRYRRAANLREYVIPAGTTIHVRTTELIDSDSALVGDKFDAILEQDLIADGRVVAERGSPATMRIVEVEEAGQFRGRSVLAIDLVELTINGTHYALTSRTVEQRGASQGKRTGAYVGGGAALGAIIGGITGGSKGAAIGAIVGGASGAGVQVLTKGEKLKIPAETVLQFNLQEEARLQR